MFLWGKILTDALYLEKNIDGQHLRPPAVSAILLETIERENCDGA